MTIHINKIAVAALSLAIIGLAAPVRSVAQDDSNNPKQADDAANKKIDLDLESTNLYYGLKLLFSQVKANFTIDESLKSLTVTAHLTQVPFRIALETLLKSTSTPLTYKVENGIYSVVPKVETGESVIPEDQPGNTTLPNPNAGWKYGIIRPENMSAIDIVQAFGGHIVNVGYTPQFGQGGLGGGQSAGQGGFGGAGSGGFGNGAGYGGSPSGTGSQFGSGSQGGSIGGSGNSGFSGLHGF
jgi:hypothetical protein